jgi:hypothetical protein
LLAAFPLRAVQNLLNRLKGRRTDFSGRIVAPTTDGRSCVSLRRLERDVEMVRLMRKIVHRHHYRYGSRAMGKFTRPDYSRENAPDASALPHLRHPHGEHAPRKELFRTLNGIPGKKGKITRGGSIADATIIEVPSSAENSAKSRDTEMKPA